MPASRTRPPAPGYPRRCLQRVRSFRILMASAIMVHFNRASITESAPSEVFVTNAISYQFSVIGGIEDESCITYCGRCAQHGSLAPILSRLTRIESLSRHNGEYWWAQDPFRQSCERQAARGLPALRGRPALEFYRALAESGRRPGRRDQNRSGWGTS